MTTNEWLFVVALCCLIAYSLGYALAWLVKLIKLRLQWRKAQRWPKIEAPNATFSLQNLYGDLEFAGILLDYTREIPTWGRHSKRTWKNRKLGNCNKGRK